MNKNSNNMRYALVFGRVDEILLHLILCYGNKHNNSLLLKCMILMRLACNFNNVKGTYDCVFGERFINATSY